LKNKKSKVIRIIKTDLNLQETHLGKVTGEKKNQLPSKRSSYTFIFSAVLANHFRFRSQSSF